MRRQIHRQCGTALFLVALVSLAGCTARKPADSPAAPEAARTEAKPELQPAKELQDAFAKLKTAYPYRVTETSKFTGTGNNTQDLSRVVEFAAPDRSHTKMGEMELITYGDKSYMKIGDKWRETPRPPKPPGVDLEALLAAMIKDVQQVGTETLDGVSCSVYTARYEGNFGGQPIRGTGKMWIGSADGLLRQTDSKTKLGDYNSESRVVYQYGVSVDVQKPLP